MLRICQVGCCALVALGVQLSGGSVAWGQFEVVGREPAGGPAAADVPAHGFCHCLGDAGSDSVARINRALAGQLLQGGLEFVDAPLEDVMNVLQEEYEIPIQLDTPALEDIGIGPDEPVTVSVRNISLRSALRLMLGRLQLTYVICNEMLMITTPDEAETELVVCVYSVGDLCGTGTNPASFDRLIDVIVSTVATETWAENGGGEAEIRSLPFGVLVVSQTQAVHEEIRDLLRALRAAIATSPPPARAAALSTAPEDEAVVTRYFDLPAGDRDRWGPQLIRLIRESLPDRPWQGNLKDGSSVLLVALPDRLVVRHRQSVVEQVVELLRDVGVEPRFQGGGMGGGTVGRGGGGGQFSTPPAGDNPFGF